jgi:hypothetical protein
MTTSALVMMLMAWCIIAFFAIRFLVKVIKTPQEKELVGLEKNAGEQHSIEQ